MVSRLFLHRRTVRYGLFFIAYIALAIHSEYWLGVVTTHPIGDDFKIYYGAYLKAGQGENPYQPFGIGSGFVNHPAALTFVSLFAWSQNQPFATGLWIAVSALVWVACIWLALRLARDALTGECGAGTIPASRAWLAAGIFLGFAPLWETLHIGQVNTFAVACSLLSLYFARRDKPPPAGLALSLAIVLKTSPVILLAYFAVTRRVRMVAWTLVGLALMSAVAAAQFSPAVFKQFWAILPRLALDVYPDSWNQSILSVLYRAFSTFDGQGLKDALTEIHRIAFAIVTGALLGWGTWDYRRNQQLSLWLFMALTTVSVVFSPLVWYHHSTFLLLPLTALILSPNQALSVAGLGMVFLLQAERLFEQAITPTAYPVVLIHFGLLAALIFIYRKCRRGPAVPFSQQIN